MEKLVILLAQMAIIAIYVPFFYIYCIVVISLIDTATVYASTILEMIPLPYIIAIIVAAFAVFAVIENWQDRRRYEPLLAGSIFRLKSWFGVKSVSAEKLADESIAVPDGPIGVKFSFSSGIEQLSALALIEEFDNSSRPRLQHQFFAYKYIPEKLRENPDIVRQWLTGDKAAEHLVTRWSLLPLTHGINRRDCFSPDGMDCQKTETDNEQEIVVIRFPPPKRTAEAFFGAIVFGRDSKYRYFTLEAVTKKPVDHIRETVFVERTENEIHYLSEGSAMNSEEFLKLILDRIDPLSQEILLVE